MLLHILVGTIYFVMSTTAFVINLLVMLVAEKSSENKSTTSLIVKNVCFSCILQLIPFMFGGIMCITDSPFNYYSDRILGVLLESGWFMYIGLSLALAVDRLIVFMSPQSALFRSRITYLFIFLSWILWLGSLVVLCLPDFGYSFQTAQGRIGWGYRRDLHGAVIMAEVESYLDLTVFSIMLLVYLLVFGYLFKIRKASSDQPPFSTVEMKILITALISFAYESFFVIWSFWSPPVPFDMLQKRIVMNVMWIIDAGLFSTVSIIVNNRVQTKIKEMIWRQKHVVVNVNVIVCADQS
ncbi:hypothetical protein QR680_003720 [Steinernema hermaphroditum]|uniref:Uncharacterized protein n=1 Tax=Steinernema hermaphroditum TaxID=289476 RepID=A0AA39HNK5_9BILA|nr:hypothetical protein QR680_003720 [Steinernema hermaphroditum]